MPNAKKTEGRGEGRKRKRRKRGDRGGGSSQEVAWEKGEGRLRGCSGKQTPEPVLRGLRKKVQCLPGRVQGSVMIFRPAMWLPLAEPYEHPLVQLPNTRGSTADPGQDRGPGAKVPGD